ncbi:hypothetical protein K9M79_08940 [Candidatus Woesearchaeota archaeon]|nr:hypothetical protein [Candidatus Woesearchaeota archaeon]
MPNLISGIWDRLSGKTEYLEFPEYKRRIDCLSVHHFQQSVRRHNLKHG